MRFPRVQFTVRRMMVAVMVAAIALAAVPLKRRSDEFRRRAAVHAWLSQPGGGSYIGDFDRLMREMEMFRTYHSRMWRKYEYLACHPCLSADPDPPPPAVSFTVQ